MTFHGGLLSSQLSQLVFVAVLVIISVAVGQIAYRHASRVHTSIKDTIADRKQPRLRYILYEIFWAPGTLFIVLGLIRIGMLPLPTGSVAYSLTTVVDILLILTLFWLSIRIIQQVFQIAETTSDEP